MRLTIEHMDHGYAFLLDGEEIAIGEYVNGKFILLEENDSSQWPNAMIALSHLRHKYTPEFYRGPVFKRVIEDDSITKISKYKGHIVLQSIDKEAFHAWEQKYESGRRKS